jgi:hypothetical protein
MRMARRPASSCPTTARTRGAGALYGLPRPRRQAKIPRQNRVKATIASGNGGSQMGTSCIASAPGEINAIHSTASIPRLPPELRR